MLQAVAMSKFCFPSATHSVKDIRAPTDEIVTLHGHLDRKPRIQANRTFAELRDEHGKVIQIHMAPKFTDQALIDKLCASGPEDSVVVSGFVQPKPPKKGSSETEYELAVLHFQNLNSASVDAAQLDKIKHLSPQLIPPQFRYLQLRTQPYQEALRTRSKMLQFIRKILVEEFESVEIETPILFKLTPEGAREFLVPSRSPNRLYALPQSPQQYKQILMSSGFSRYFQIAKCFRDEDMRADRQPEFTQVDIEMGFVNDKTQVMGAIDRIITGIWVDIGCKPIYSLDSNGNLRRMENNPSEPDSYARITYDEAMTKYGIDKPDLRSSLEFVDLLKFFLPIEESEAFGVVEACVLKGAFDPNRKFKIPANLTDKEQYNSRKPIVITINSEKEAQTWYSKFLEVNVLQRKRTFNELELADALSLTPGDILAISTRQEQCFENPTPLGRFRKLAIDEFPGKWIRPIYEADGSIKTESSAEKISVGCWIVDFPLFSPVEHSSPPANFPNYVPNIVEATHHPFTMPKIEDFALLDKDPLSVRGEHYDFVLNGVEVGGGSRRIHDAKLQEYVLERLLRIKNYNELFGHLLRALSMGCPPHAGIALGFDRLCAMLLDKGSIRDVIAFPKTQSGTDPVVNSPTEISDELLKSYHLKRFQ